jgi:hypothetical protein
MSSSLLVLVIGFLSRNVAILHVLKLAFSSVFAEYKAEKTKQGTLNVCGWEGVFLSIQFKK